MRKKSSKGRIKKEIKLAKKQALIDESIAEISKRIMDELENASSKDLSEAKYAKKILRLSDLRYTNKILRNIESVSDRTENSIEKRAVIQALLVSTWIQRLYFIIRAAIMSVLGGVVTFVYVSFFGQIGVSLAVIMGVVIFIVGLIITRLFEIQIVKITKYIVRHLNYHERIREFIMNHF